MAESLTAAQRRLGAAREKARRGKLGPVLRQTDADLAAVAEVRPADLALVEAFVRDAAGSVGVALLRAESDA